MVLTNFELWAADGSSASALPLDYESNTHTRHLNPFDTRVVPQLNANFNNLSSNGYYGFSYINAAHISDNNNNNNIIINNNNNDNNNNISCTTYNLMTNDVNGINNTATTTQQTHASSVNFSSAAYAAGNAVNVARCKKRYFVVNDDDSTAATVTNSYEVSAKRCRFDDDFSAQYCNDFFQLPSTQIATQSCLMDIEEAPQQQQHMLQQQVNEAMFENNNNNIEKYEQNTINRQLENVQTLSAQNHQKHSQHSQQQQLLQIQQQQPEQQQQQQNLYHHQQHYQDINNATITNHYNNSHSCDTLTLNNTKQTCQTVSNETENVFKTLNLKPNNNNSNCNENEKLYKTDNDVVDDATLFAQLHGGCLHHHHHNFPFSGNYKNSANICLSDGNCNEEF